MIRLNVFIQVASANHDALLEAAKELTAHSVKEAGCIAYDVFQSATRPDVLMICETWENLNDLTNHEKSEHFVRLVGKMQELGKLKLEKFEF